MLFDSHSRDWRWPLSPSSRLLTVCLWSKTGTFSRNKREVLCELWCVASKIEGKECISASLEKVSINFVNTPTGWIINFFGLLLSPPSYLMKGGRGVDSVKSLFEDWWSSLKIIEPDFTFAPTLIDMLCQILLLRPSPLEGEGRRRLKRIMHAHNEQGFERKD